MVTGVHGELDHAVRHVVVEYGIILECVMIPYLHVEEKTVKVLAFMRKNAMIFVVQVRYAWLL